MASTKIELKHGVTLGEKKHMTVSIRELTPGDLIDAGLQSERIVDTEDGPAFAVSPTLMGLNTLARQLDKIGDVDAVFTVDDLKRFHREDFDYLQLVAEQIDQAVFKAILERGKSDASGNQPADANT